MDRLPQIRLTLMILLIASASLIDGRKTNAQSISTGNQISTLQNSQNLHQERIEELNRAIDRIDKHLEFDDAQLADLKDDQHTWKGIVVGIGSVIAILELLQALGFARGKYNMPERKGP
jgi:hypothetical protein